MKMRTAGRRLTEMVGANRGKLLVLAAFTVVIAGAVHWGYTLVSNGPERFVLEDGIAEDSYNAEPTMTGNLDGRWVAGSGSEAGYRVEKILVGKAVEVVGRGPLTAGSISIKDGIVVGGEFIVELAALRTDNPQRDAAFRGRIMNTGTWPEARFTLKEPIEIKPDLRAGEVAEGRFLGELSMRGLTRRAEFEYQASYNPDGSISLVASHVAAFAEWGIQNPSKPGVIVKESAILEVSVNLVREP